jgi:hypothetical protein
VHWAREAIGGNHHDREHDVREKRAHGPVEFVIAAGDGQSVLPRQQVEVGGELFQMRALRGAFWRGRRWYASRQPAASPLLDNVSGFR